MPKSETSACRQVLYWRTGSQMPNRIVRDSLLDSERYLGLTHHVERVLFFELLLLADDYGIVPLGNAFLTRRTTACSGLSPEQTIKVVMALTDADLIRAYHSDSGSRFAYIPRFGNSPRALKPKWPMPSDSIGGNEIKDLQRKRMAGAYHLRANAPETETETETETEKKAPSARPKRAFKSEIPKSDRPVKYSSTTESREYLATQAYLAEQTMTDDQRESAGAARLAALERINKGRAKA